MVPDYPGIDVGSVSVELALIGADDSISAFNLPNAFFCTLRIFGCLRFGFLPTADQPPVDHGISHRSHLLRAPISAHPDSGGIRGTGVVGSGGKRLSALLGAPYENECKALLMGVASSHPEVRTASEMGGDTSKYLRLVVRDGEVGIVDYYKGGDCAAGRSSFIDEQASRLKYVIEEAGTVALKADKGATVVGRCPVFAKTDMIHAQRKGFLAQGGSRGLCQAVGRNFSSSITEGREIVPEVVLNGGIAASQGVAQTMREIF